MVGLRCWSPSIAHDLHYICVGSALFGSDSGTVVRVTNDGLWRGCGEGARSGSNSTEIDKIELAFRRSNAFILLLPMYWKIVQTHVGCKDGWPRDRSLTFLSKRPGIIPVMLFWSSVLVTTSWRLQHSCCCHQGSRRMTCNCMFWKSILCNDLYRVRQCLAFRWYTSS